MLSSLRIRNLAIIDELTLDFEEGLTVLTGETGTGKSILAGALELVLGERATLEDIRTGCEAAEVEALFQVPGNRAVEALLREWDLVKERVEDGELVLRREINLRGRSRCRVNGRIVSLAQLRGLGDLLVDLHGQHRHQSLLDPDRHRELLDAYGGASLEQALETFRGCYERYRAVAARLRELARNMREAERTKDLLAYQVREIDEVGPEEGEEERLEEERRRLRHAVELRRLAGGVLDLLYDGEAEPAVVSDLLGRAIGLAREAAGLDPALAEAAGRLEVLLAEVDDLASEFRRYAEELCPEPARLEAVEERLHRLHRLRAKYGDTIADVLAEGKRMQDRLERLQTGSEERERLEAEQRELERTVVAAAETLSGERRKAGAAFSRALVRLLGELDMKGTRFEARLEREEVSGGDGEEAPLLSAPAVPFPGGRRFRLDPRGVDRVEFFISTNPGEGLKPLRKIASGGELSRIMLALKRLVRARTGVPTLLFDEIDAGVGGRTGHVVAENLVRLGERYQVICITHLPQIAARARDHRVVRKERIRGRTVTRVERIRGEDRVRELARLLSGRPDSSTARRHAEELLARTDEP